MNVKVQWSDDLPVPALVAMVLICGALWVALPGIWKAGAAVCVAAYLLPVLWPSYPVASWSIVARGLVLAALLAWVMVNVEHWFIQPLMAAAPFQPINPACEVCDTGGWPWWYCVLIGCW